jgi:LysM repeat protein
MKPAHLNCSWHWRNVALFVCLLFLSLFPSIARAEEGSDLLAQLSGEGQAIAVAINQRRAEAGLPPLALHPLLNQAAQNHVNDIAAGRGYGHVGPDGSNVRQRVQRVGYSSGGFASENWVNSTSPDGAMTWWMNDWIHRVNILNERWREFGVGVADAGGGRQIYVTVFTAGDGIGGETVTPLPVVEQVAPVQGSGLQYTIQAGDTLIGIAARHGIDWTLIAQENQLREETLLQIGQVIRLPGVQGAQQSEPAPVAASGFTGGAGGSYTVQPGDTLLSIAIRHNLTWQQLGAANGLGERDLLQIGQQLVIPGAAAQTNGFIPAPSQPAPSTELYTVQSGDTILSIAINQGLDWQQLLAINGFQENTLLQIGQQIRLR